MNAAQNLDDILDEGLKALDLRWDDAGKTSDGSGRIELPISDESCEETCTGIRRVLVRQTSDAPPSSPPTWEDVTKIEPLVADYARCFEEGMHAGAQDVAEYRYRTPPKARHFAIVAYHQKQGELFGEALQKYIDGFVEGALSKLRRRRRWSSRPPGAERVKSAANG